MTGLLSGAYGRVALLRRAWYARPGRRRRLNHRVISVGNLSVGGSGKTPVVETLARLLRNHGDRPVILTRGYGRRDPTEGVLVVSDGTRVLEPVTRSGDEPQLLARNVPGVPVLVSADRYIAGLFAEKHFQPTVSILDDGFQHLQLERDVDLLLVSPADLDDRVLPAGRLREPIDAAQFADAVLVSDADVDIETVAATLLHHKAFRIVPYYEPIWRVRKDPPYVERVDPPYVDRVDPPYVDRVGRVLSDPATRVVAFAGIARPARFFNALRSLGYDVARELTFRDHHWYTARDLETIRAAARDVNTDFIVTTEKDAVRCDMDVAVLQMTVSIEPAAQFTEWLLGRLAACAPKPRSGEGG